MRKLQSNTTLRDQAIAAVRNAILLGELKPGQQLSLRILAELLGVSIGPVREAVRVLEQQGLLVQDPKAGIAVANPSVEELTGAVRVRAALEDLAVEQALENPDERHWAALCERLEGLLDRMRALGEELNGERANELDLEWHKQMIEAAGNPVLSRMWEQLGLPASFNLILVMVGRVRPLPNRLAADRNLADHEALLAVLRTRDPEACHKAVRAHVTLARTRGTLNADKPGH